MMLLNLVNLIKQSINNKKGQGLVEYVLLLAGIALIVVALVTPLGAAITTKVTEILANF